MNIFIIYKATNIINGKVYIGFDSVWPKRQKSHKFSSFNSNGQDYNFKFHRAIRKYGWEAFEWEEICCSKDGEYLLNEMEKYFIQQYDSYNNGYNMTLGGEGCFGRIFTKQSKEKISKGNKGKIRSEKFKQDVSKSRKGFKHTFEAKIKISKTHTNRIHTDEARRNMGGNRGTPNAKDYLLIDPNGVEYKVTNLAEFCRNNPQYKLHSRSISNNINNNINNYKNWKIYHL